MTMNMLHLLKYLELLTETHTLTKTTTKICMFFFPLEVLLAKTNYGSKY